MSKMLTDELIPALKEKLITPTYCSFNTVEGVSIIRNSTYRVSNLLLVSLQLSNTNEVPAQQYDIKLGSFDLTPLATTEMSYSFNNDSYSDWSRCSMSANGVFLVKSTQSTTTLKASTAISISGVVILND